MTDGAASPSIRASSSPRASPGAIALDVVAVLAAPTQFSSGPADLGGLGTTAAAAIAVAGAVVLVRSIRWGGRFGWVAAAGASLSVIGLASLAAHRTTDPNTLRLVGRATSGTTGLTGAMLLVFVVIGLQLSRRACGGRATARPR